MGLINKDNHVYSYSQLSSFSECPFGFYLDKIEKAEDKSSNIFAEQGSLIHNLLDEWGKGELSKDQLVDEYERRYPQEVVTYPPKVLAAKGYAAKTYELGRSYFENFDEFVGYKVISTEERFFIDLPLTNGETRKFCGFVDMILVDELSEDLIICDHKSKSLSAFKKDEDEMYRQQTLYALYVKEKYGKYPDLMMFNLFKEGGMKMTRKFTEEELNKTLEWATDAIEKIESFEVLDWLETKPTADFFCTEICSVRKNCPNGIPVRNKNKKER